MLPKLKLETVKRALEEEEGTGLKYVEELISENPLLAAMCITAEASETLNTPVVAFLYHLLKVQDEIDELKRQFKGLRDENR